MQVVADLHLHSRYSRAVSQSMTLPVMAQYAVQKGLDLLSASDFTHPLWFKEIKSALIEENDGIYVLKAEKDFDRKTRFLLSTEIASIYKQGDKLRRIHSLVFVPNLTVAEQVSKELLKRGANLHSDGRPIIGLSSKQLLDLILSVNERAFLIPCHVWTPHFGLYGSASGFDSIDESFEDLSQYVYGIETGLSSDPDMNWQMPELKRRSILSFSDAHSPAKMGREATVFELAEVTYENVRKAIMEKSLTVENRRLKVESDPPSIIHHPSPNKIIYTIEFYPEEGKYHFSGHRNCGISFGPEEIAEKGNMCPVCNRRLTEGVMYRVQTLAGENFKPRAIEKANEYGLKWHIDSEKLHPPYVKLVQLLEIVAESLSATVASQKVRDLYATLCAEFGSELAVLLKVPTADIVRIGGEKIAEGVQKVRAGDIAIVPGFDGEYGKVKIWNDKKEAEQRQEDASQLSLDV